MTAVKRLLALLLLLPGLAFGQMAGGIMESQARALSSLQPATSAQLAGVLTDETGTGAAVFQNGDLSTLIASGTSGHAIGIAASVNRQFNIGGAFTGVAASIGIDQQSAITTPANVVGYLHHISGTLIEAASGTHARLVGLRVAPNFTNGAATTTDAISAEFNSFTAPAGTTNASTLKVTDAPTAATNNYALWVAAGTTRLDGNVTGAGAITSSSPTAGLGYATGAGSTVTQITSKATAVTLNTVTGNITMSGAALAAATIVTFVFNNSAVTAQDLIACTHHSTGTTGAYTINCRATGAGTAAVDVRNNTAGSLSEAIVIKFAVIKGVTS